MTRLMLPISDSMIMVRTKKDIGDGLGNPAYDPEKAMLEARGIANGVEEYNLDYYAAPDANAGPPIAPRCGAGFRILESDVWKKVNVAGVTRPSFLLLKKKGESIDHEFAKQIGVPD
jgi:hypothetical protein